MIRIGDILYTILVILLVISGIAAIFLMQNSDEKDENILAYTDLIKEVSYGNVEKIEMTTGSTTVKVKMKNVEEEKTTIVPNTQAFIELVQQKVAEGNEIELVQKPKSVFATIGSTIFSLLPTFIMIALFVMIFKMQGLGEKGQVYDDTQIKTKVKFYFCPIFWLIYNEFICNNKKKLNI